MTAENLVEGPMEGGMEYRTMSSASASAAATINLAPRSAHAGRHPRRDHRRRRRSVVAPARNQRVRSLDDDGGALLNDGASVQVFVKGALPFSVAGCKMSEEINFADHLCRCVLVDGLPKRCRASPVKNLKTPERRTVRAIRHAKDYDAIRFSIRSGRADLARPVPITQEGSR